ncbi:hypothetical protein [Desulfocicer niacini]
MTMDDKKKANIDALLDDGMFTGGELSEDNALDDEMFTGVELGEDDVALRKNTQKPNFKTKTRPGLPGKTKKKKTTGIWPMIMGVMIMLVIIGTLVGFMIQQKRISQQMAGQAISSLTLPISPKKELYLKDFIVPLKVTHLYTCITFSVVIYSWENDFVSPLIHEKQWLRGKLYDILVKKIEKETDTPSLEMFRLWVQQAVRQLLPDRHIISVEIHQFLVV